MYVNVNGGTNVLLGCGVRSEDTNAKEFATLPSILVHLFDHSLEYKEAPGGGSSLHMFPSYITKDAGKDLWPELELVNACLRAWTTQQRGDVLLHPAFQFFLYEKCKKIRGVFLLSILVQFAWMATVVGFSLNATDSDPQNRSPWAIYLGMAVVIVYIIVSTSFEFYEIYKNKWDYLRHLSNYLQWTRNIMWVAITFIQFSDADKTAMHPDTIPLFASASLLSIVLATRHVRHIHQSMGLSFEIFKQVVQKIGAVLIHCSTIFLGFLISLRILYGRHDTEVRMKNFNESWPAPIYQTLIQMTGETEIEFLPYFTMSSTERHDETFFHLFARNAVYSLFFLCMVLAFYNQLTGVALDKIQEIHERAKVERVVGIVDYIYSIESWICCVYRILGWRGVGVWLKTKLLSFQVMPRSWRSITVEIELPYPRFGIADSVMYWLSRIPDIRPPKRQEYKIMCSLASKNKERRH